MTLVERAVCATIVALVAVLLVASIYEEGWRWPHYRDAHHCAETGASRPETVYHWVDFGKSGSMLPFTEYRHEWACDAGERIWR